MDDNVEFVNVIRYICLDELNCWPANEDMVGFFLVALSRISSLRVHAFYVQARFFMFLSFCHVAPNFPKEEFDSGQVRTTNLDLSCVMEPVHAHLLSSVSEKNCFTNLQSKCDCLELLECFSDNALQPGSKVW